MFKLIGIAALIAAGLLASASAAGAHTATAATAAAADDGDTIGGYTTDDVASALAAALQAKDVPTADSDVKVTVAEGLFHFSVRLSANVKPVGQAPASSDGTPPASVQAAPLLLIGAVQVIDDQVRVTMRIVVTETSQIVEASTGDASGKTKDAITDAAQIAIGGLPSLNQ